MRFRPRSPSLTSIWAALAMMGWPSPALPMASLPFSTISLKGLMTSSSTSSMVEARSESASTAYWLIAIPSQSPCDADVAAAAAAAVEVIQSQLQQNVVRLNVRLGSAGCVERASWRGSRSSSSRGLRWGVVGDCSWA